MGERQTGDALFLAVAHPVRRAVLEALVEAGPHGTLPVADLDARLRSRGHDLTAPALSQHLRALREAVLVDGARVGREWRYRLTPEPLLDVIAWMRGFEAAWRDQADRLGAFLDAR